MKHIIFSFLICTLLFSCQADPEDFKFTTNFNHGLTKAQLENKPIFIQFYGHSCSIPIREKEYFNALILTSHLIQSKLDKNFISLSLNVDGRNKISVKDTLGIFKILTNKDAIDSYPKIKNVGNLNSILQLELFNATSQPYYGFIDSNQNSLTTPFDFDTLSQSLFMQKMDEALLNFRQGK